MTTPTSLMRIAIFGFGVVIMCSVPVAAQEDAPRGYVQALGGIATTTVTDGVFGGSAGFRITSRIEAFGEVGRMRNGIWKALDTELASAGDEIRARILSTFGSAATVNFEARVPVLYGLAGGRITGPRLGFLNTYAEGGVGLARLRPEVHLAINGDELDEEAAGLLTLDEERTEVMSAAGAGVAFRILKFVRVEAGYRYSRIHGDLPVNINRVHLGAGYAF